MSSGKYKYCPLCGERTDEVSESGYRRKKCGACDFVQYFNPAPAVGVIVLEGNTVLLVKRRFDPYMGMWSIPSGFIEYEEDVRETAVRELKEETGLTVELEGLHAVESCFDDPRGNTLLVLYMGRITDGELHAGDDAADVRFFPLDGLPQIAFEAHRRVLGRFQKIL